MLYTKYENEDYNKVMENQCQHLTEVKRDEFIKLLQNIDELFDGTLGTWKAYAVEFKLKEDAKPIGSIPHSVPKVHKEMFKMRLTI